MPILTLSSDIGDQDFLIAAVKGEILQQNQEFRIIDISHRLKPFDYYQAYYVLKNAILHFPEDSFHILLNNLYNEKPRKILFADLDGRLIACANNGLLSMILEGNTENIFSVEFNDGGRKDTFAYIRIVCNIFNEILAGNSLERVAQKDDAIRISNPLRPTLGSDWIEGQILFVDNFENVVVNITREQFEEQRRGRSFSIVFRRDEEIQHISESYADVPEGEKLALFNSAGFLEIAMNKGPAAGLFGLQGFSADNTRLTTSPFNTNVFYQTVKVFFK